MCVCVFVGFTGNLEHRRNCQQTPVARLPAVRTGDFVCRAASGPCIELRKRGDGAMQDLR